MVPVDLMDVDWPRHTSEPGSRIVKRDARPAARSGLALGAAPQLGAARAAAAPQAHVQLRIVLVGDQDLRDVALGGRAQLHALAAASGCGQESGNEGMSGADRTLSRAMAAIDYTCVAPTARDACG